MARESLYLDKPHVNVGTIGHVGHGKTTLTTAITRVQSLKGWANYISYDSLVASPQDSSSSRVPTGPAVEYQSPTRHYGHIDIPDHASIVKNMIVGDARMDGAILVVSAADGPMPQTRKHIRLAHQVGVPKIVVFLSKVDLDDDYERLELVEMEIRELLTEYGFPGDDIPIIRGNAFAATKAESPDDPACECITKLIETLDSYIDVPLRVLDLPFLMPIEDVFSIEGRGTVVTGRVDRGIIKVGDSVEIVGIRPTATTVVTDIEAFRKCFNQAKTGNNVGCFLRGIQNDQVERGQVLATPKTIFPHTEFKAQVYVLTRDEGGRHKPFVAGYRPQFHIRTTDVTGGIRLPEGVEMVMPGDNVEMTVKLTCPVALEKGMRFDIREDGRSVGAGRIIEIIDSPDDADVDGAVGITKERKAMTSTWTCPHCGASVKVSATGKSCALNAVRRFW